MVGLLNGEKAKLLKQDGTSHTLTAQFDSKQIITFDVKVPIEAGDVFERVLPNGAVERFEVSEPTFYGDMGLGFGPNYQCKIRRARAKDPVAQTSTGGSTREPGQITALTEAQQGVLEQIAEEQLKIARAVEGNVLRLRRVPADEVVPTLPPGLVEMKGSAPPDEIYWVTLSGWLQTRRAGEIRNAVENTLAYLRQAIEADAYKREFPWEELKRHAGAADDAIELYRMAADVMRLSLHGYAVGGTTFTIERPSNRYLMTVFGWHSVEDVLRQHQQWDQHAQAGSHTRDTSPTKSQQKGAGIMKRRVFVVYGHDEAAKEALYSFLRIIGLEVITWGHAKAAGSGAQSNHEIVRNGIDRADAVIVLFTPDELAQRSTELGGDPQAGYQPRPNVLFEAGWAFGANRDKTLIVEVGGLHRLSDIDGINTVRMTAATSLNDLANDLEAIGCAIDRKDNTWNDVSKYPGLFRTMPRSPTKSQPTELDAYQGMVDVTSSAAWPSISALTRDYSARGQRPDAFYSDAVAVLKNADDEGLVAIEAILAKGESQKQRIGIGMRVEINYNGHPQHNFTFTSPPELEKKEYLSAAPPGVPRALRLLGAHGFGVVRGDRITFGGESDEGRLWMLLHYVRQRH